MNMTSTHASTMHTAVSLSVATLSSEFLSNDGEKPNQPKRFMFPKCNYGSKISMKHAFSLALSRIVIHKSILEGWSFWDSVSINPIFSTINCWGDLTRIGLDTG